MLQILELLTVNQEELLLAEAAKVPDAQLSLVKNKFLNTRQRQTDTHAELFYSAVIRCMLVSVGMH